MARPLNQQTVVITGASSGIGRQAALQFGRAGASVVLAARNEVGLREAVEQIEADGGRALAVVTDVAEWPQVRALADRAAEWGGGRIDTWVNNAAVSAYGTVADLSVEEIDRIIRVDLMGQVHGVKAALEHMLPRDEGTIINVASVISDRAFPLQAAYSAAKHGVKGFTESLRMELEHDNRGVKVSMILPGTINTPFFSNARSKLGVHPKGPPPIYEPEAVADAILFCAETPRRDVYVGAAARQISLMQRFLPTLTEKLFQWTDAGFSGQMTDQPDDGRDNLFEPILGPGSVRGRFTDQAHSNSLYTQAFELRPGLTLAVLAGAALGLAAVAAGALGDGRDDRGPLDRARRRAVDALA